MEREMFRFLRECVVPEYFMIHHERQTELRGRADSSGTTLDVHRQRSALGFNQLQLKSLAMITRASNQTNINKVHLWNVKELSPVRHCHRLLSRYRDHRRG